MAKTREMLDDGLTDVVISDSERKEWSLEDFAAAAIEGPDRGEMKS
jgi:hypothetical protein